MIMEFKLNPQKVKDADYNIEKCYKVLDEGMIKLGFVKKDDGMYWTDDFNKMYSAQLSLAKTKWFTKTVQEWYERFYSDSIFDREDALKTFHEYGYLVK